MAGAGKGSKANLGFIGMGLMGSRMAAQLLDAGYPVTVYNRTDDKIRPLSVAQQMYPAERARGKEEDFSAVIRLMEDFAGVRAGEKILLYPR